RSRVAADPLAARCSRFYPREFGWKPAPLDCLWEGAQDRARRERESMKQPKSDLLQGTLDLLILKALSFGPLHGYAVARRIQQTSKEVLKVEEGSLYPALHRLEQRDWIASEW